MDESELDISDYDSENNIAILLTTSFAVSVVGGLTLFFLSGGPELWGGSRIGVKIIPANVAMVIGISLLSLIIMSVFLKLYNDVRIKHLKEKVLGYGVLEEKRKEYYTELLKSSDERVINIVLNNQEKFGIHVENKQVLFENIIQIGSRKALKIFLKRTNFASNERLIVQALFYLCEKGNTEIVKELIPLVDVDIQIDNGFTFLMTAAFSGSNDIVKLLLKAGADPNKVNKKGYTALMIGAVEGYVDIVEQLVKAGADLEVKCKDYSVTALLSAASNKKIKVVKLLLKAGASPHIGNDKYEVDNIEGWCDKKIRDLLEEARIKRLAKKERVENRQGRCFVM